LESLEGDLLGSVPPVVVGEQVDSHQSTTRTCSMLMPVADVPVTTLLSRLTKC
jgi:hypothetical protein